MLSARDAGVRAGVTPNVYPRLVALQLPSSLSPSKISTFTDCGLLFRFSAIDRLPEPPSAVATKGSIVHRALELLHWEEPRGQRTLAAALSKLERARAEFRQVADFADLALPEDEEQAFFDDAVELVRNYFALEDPNEVNAIGLELMLEAQVGTLRLRGIIDRLEIGSDGELVVTDYKTGTAPSETYEQKRLGGVHFYAFLCEQVLGRRPARIQLLHLRDPMAVIATPSDQSIRGLQTKAEAIWSAIEKACATETFRPRVSFKCEWCAFKAYCPEWGGDPEAARALSAATT